VQRIVIPTIRAIHFPADMPVTIDGGYHWLLEAGTRRGSVSVLRDLPVAVREGTVLGVNVVLPAGGGRFPVPMSAHRFHIIKMLSGAVDEAAPRVAGCLRD
jgi:predicted acyl esterase